MGRRGSLGDEAHLPRTVTPPRGLGGRPSVATLSHSDMLRRLPDEPHRAARRADPNDLWTPSNGSKYLGSALAVDDFPTAIRLTTSRAIGRLCPAIHRYSLFILPAVLAGGILIGWLRCYGAGITAVRIAPTDRTA